MSMGGGLNFNTELFCRLLGIHGSIGVAIYFLIWLRYPMFFDQNTDRIQIFLLYWSLLLPLLICGLLRIRDDRKAGIIEKRIFPTFRKILIIILTNKYPAPVQTGEPVQTISPDQKTVSFSRDFRRNSDDETLDKSEHNE